MTKELIAQLQEQYNHELNNERKYQQVANFCSAHKLLGFAQYFQDQAKDETGHAKKIQELLTSKNIIAIIEPEAPRSDFGSIEEVAQFYVDTEVETTERLNNIFEESAEDGQVNAVIQDLLTEQIEEETTARDFLNQIQNIGNNLILLDEEFR